MQEHVLEGVLLAGGYVVTRQEDGADDANRHQNTRVETKSRRHPYLQWLDDTFELLSQGVSKTANAGDLRQIFDTEDADADTAPDDSAGSDTGMEPGMERDAEAGVAAAASDDQPIYKWASRSTSVFTDYQPWSAPESGVRPPADVTLTQTHLRVLYGRRGQVYIAPDADRGGHLHLSVTHIKRPSEWVAEKLNEAVADELFRFTARDATTVGLRSVQMIPAFLATIPELPGYEYKWQPDNIDRIMTVPGVAPTSYGHTPPPLPERDHEAREDWTDTQVEVYRELRSDRLTMGTHIRRFLYSEQTTTRQAVLDHLASLNYQHLDNVRPSSYLKLLAHLGEIRRTTDADTHQLEWVGAHTAGD